LHHFPSKNASAVGKEKRGINGKEALVTSPQ